MSHDLDKRNGLWALAFTGSRDAIWHKLGQEIPANATPEQIFALAQCDFTVIKRQLEYAQDGTMHLYPDRFAHVRTDTGHPVGMASSDYEIVQPSDLRDLLAKYCEVDNRFSFSTVGALNGGKRIWAQLEYNGGLTIAGDLHKAHLLASTSFDAGSSTLGKACLTRVVCANTYAGMMGEKTPMIRMRHNKKFDADLARKELANIVEGFESFKAMGDAMAKVVLPPVTIAAFIRDMLDIPQDAERKDVSTRKMNQRQAIINALQVSANERAQSPKALDAFTVLQSVTRYVDHTRDDESTENRLFGSGQALKDKAVSKLMERMAEILELNEKASAGVAIPASMAAMI